MRFICPEVEGAQTPTQVAQMILKHVFQSRTENLSSFEDLSGRWKRVLQMTLSLLQEGNFPRRHKKRLRL